MTWIYEKQTAWIMFASKPLQLNLFLQAFAVWIKLGPVFDRRNLSTPSIDWFNTDSILYLSHPRLTLCQRPHSVHSWKLHLARSPVSDPGLPLWSFLLVLAGPPWDACHRCRRRATCRAGRATRRGTVTSTGRRHLGNLKLVI